MGSCKYLLYKKICQIKYHGKLFVHELKLLAFCRVHSNEQL